MKGHIINIQKASKLGIAISSWFVIGLLLVLSVQLNLATPATSDDDSDSTLGQSNIDSNLTKQPSFTNALEKAIHGSSVTGKNEPISLFTVYTFDGLATYKSLAGSIRLRGPPSNPNSLG